MTESNADANATELAVDMTIAWLSNPNTRVGATEAVEFLSSARSAIMSLDATQGAAVSSPVAEDGDFTPAVSVRKSLASKDHIISMIDGKPYKTLRRHLSTHGLTPEQYRERYNLKADYPMVAESYSEKRRSLAKQIGLGKKR